MPKRPVKLNPTPPRVRNAFIISAIIIGGMLMAGWYQTSKTIRETDFSGIQEAFEQAAETVYIQYEDKRGDLDDERKEFLDAWVNYQAAQEEASTNENEVAEEAL